MGRKIYIFRYGRIHSGKVLDSGFLDSGFLRRIAWVDCILWWIRYPNANSAITIRKASHELRDVTRRTKLDWTEAV
jgi:hypothetical protein